MNRDMERLNGVRKLIEIAGLDTDELIIIAILAAEDAGLVATTERLCDEFPRLAGCVASYLEAAA